MADTIDAKAKELLHEMALDMGCRGIEILDVYQDAWNDLKPDSPPSAFRAAVEQVKAQSPKMFLETDWQILGDTNPARFKEREEKFRASIRTSHRVGANIFKALDTALLSPIELESLNRHLGGRGDSYDRSLLQRALRAQNGDKDAA